MKKTILIIGCLFFNIVLFASDNSYDIHSYSEIIDINENGSLSFDAQINAHFNDLTKHGIYVAVPLHFDGKIVDITNLICKTHEFQLLNDSGYRVIRIGSATSYVNENEEYIYHYDYDSHKDKYDDYDEFYFNVLGDNVNTTVADFYCEVNFPKPITTDMIFLTGGARGSKGNSVNAKYEVSDDKKRIVIEAHNIDPYSAITLRVQLSEGYFINPTPIVKTNFIKLLYTYIIMLLLLFILWYVFGRDKKPIYAVEFYPPEGMSPMDMGFIIDSSLDNKDMTAMLFYWADKGYCRIDNIDEDYEVVAIKDIDDSAPKYEKDLFDMLFYRIGKGGVINNISRVDSSDNSFEIDLESLRADQKKHLTNNINGKGKNLYSTVSQIVKGIASIVFVLSILAFYIEFIEPSSILGDDSAFINISFCLQIIHAIIMLYIAKNFEIRKLVDMKYGIYTMLIRGILLSAINFGAVYMMLHLSLNLVYGFSEYLFLFLTYYLYVFFGAILVALIKKKSKEYITLLSSTLGFYDFVNKVEIGQLKALIHEDPKYYYKTLSYSIVLGLENIWANKFKLIDMEAPKWSNSSSLNDTMTFSLMTSSIVNSVSSSIEKSLPSRYSGYTNSGSSSNGFSGFSSGGGGGGGVGSW